MRVRVLGIVSASLLLLWSGCNLNVDYFSDYNGVNLLSAHQFSTAGWASNTVGVDTPSPGNLYMVWSDLLTTGPGGGEAFNLENVNLIPDGNFNSTTVNSAYWTATSATPTASNSSTLPAVVINSASPYYLAFNAANQSDVLKLNLYAAINAVTGLPKPASHSYQFQADLVDLNTTQFKVTYTTNADNAPSPVTVSDVNASLSGLSQSAAYSLSSLPGVATSLNMSYATTLSSARLDFNNGTSSMHFELDNVRLVPDDLDLYTKTTLTSLNSAAKTLIPGKYKFSLYVRDNVNAGTLNHMFASGVSVRITAATKNNLTKQVLVTASRSSGWSSWTKLTFDLGTLDFVDSEGARAGNPALVIEVSPTIMNSGTRDAGSLDVSDPTLTFVNS